MKFFPLEEAAPEGLTFVPLEKEETFVPLEQAEIDMPKPTTPVALKADAKPQGGFLDGFVRFAQGVRDLIPGAPAYERDRLERAAGVGGSVFSKDYSTPELQAAIEYGKAKPGRSPGAVMTEPSKDFVPFKPPVTALEVAGSMPKLIGNRVAEPFAAAGRVYANMNDDALAEQQQQERLRRLQRSTEFEQAPMTGVQKAVSSGVAEGARQFTMAAPGMLAGAPGFLQLAGSMAAPAAAEATSRYLDQGLSLGRAATAGVLQGVVEGGTEALPMKWMLGKVGNLPSLWDTVRAGDKAAAGQLLGYYMKAQGMEVGQEVPATLGNWLIDKATADPTATPERLSKDMVEMLKQLPIQSLTQAGLVHAAQRVPGMVERVILGEKGVAMADLADLINGEFAPGTQQQVLDAGESARVAGLNAGRVMQPPSQDPPAPPAAGGMPMAPIEQRAPGTLFHGTSSDVGAFDRAGGGGMWGKGIYLNDDPATASGYALGTAGNRIAPPGNAGPNVMPIRIGDGELFEMAAPLTPETVARIEQALGESVRDLLWPGMKNRDLRQVLFQQFTDQDGANRVLEKAGFVGLAERSPTAGPGRTVMVFDPTTLSSDITGEGMGGMPLAPMQQGMPIDPVRDQTLEAALTDAGHRVASTGTLYGAPPGMVSHDDLVVFRNRLEKLAGEGIDGRYWYEKSGKAVLDLAEGDKDKAEKIVGLLAIYSPQQTVSGNTTLALKAYAEYQNTGKITTISNMGQAVATKAQQWMDGTLGEDQVTGVKRSNFYRNLMREVDPQRMGADAQGVTVDMHIARAGGYGSRISSGKDFEASGQYQFMEKEIKRLASSLGWEPQQAQAAIWGAIKARVDEVLPGVRDEAVKRGWLVMDNSRLNRYGKPMVSYKPTSAEGEASYEAMLLEEAMKIDAPGHTPYDFGDAIRERMAQVSWEARPGRTTGVLPGIHTAPLWQQMEYLQAVDAAMRDENGQDAIATKLGLAGSSTFFGPSAWQGEVAHGAQTETALALDRPKQNLLEAHPDAAALLNLYSAIRGYVMNQEAVVWHYPNYASTVKAANGVEINFGRNLTIQEVETLYSAISAAAGHTEWAPAVTRTGVRVLNFKGAYYDSERNVWAYTDKSGVEHAAESKDALDGFVKADGYDNVSFHKTIKGILESLPAEFNGWEFKRFGSIGDYIGNDWGSAPNGEGYRQRISEAGRPDLLRWSENLRSKVAEVNADFAARYGWDKPAATEGQGKGLPLEPLQVKGEFAPETGTLGIPRDEMPQIKIAMRPQFIEAMQGAGVTREEVRADSLKPTQKDFDTDKTARAGRLAEDRSDKSAVIVSSDGYVLDGHHRWMAKAQAGQMINVIRINMPIRQLLVAAKNFADTHQHLAQKENFVAPHVSEFIPKDVIARADNFVARYYVDRPPVVIDPADRARAEALLQPVMAKAAQVKDEYDRKVLDIENRTNAIGHQLAPLKGMGRAVEKLVTEEHFNIGGMKDILRSTIVVNDYADAQKVIDEIATEFDILRIKNRSGIPMTGPNLSSAPREDFGGYSDVLVNITMPNGVIGEIQINVPTMLSVKADHGHKLYEAAREAGKDSGLGLEIMQAASEMYDYAYPGFMDGGVARTQMPSRGSAAAGESSFRSSENLNTLPSGNSTNSSPPKVGTNRQPSGNTAGTSISSPPAGIVPRQDGTLAEDLEGQSAWLTEQAQKRGFQTVDDMLANDMPGFFALAEQWRNEHPAEVLHVDGLYGPYMIRATSGNERAVPPGAFAAKLSEKEMSRRYVQPLEAKQAAAMNDAVADLQKAGVPRSWTEGVTFYGLKPVGKGYAHYNPADTSIAMIYTALDGSTAVSKINVRGWLAHELHHRIDNYRNSSDTMYYFSDESPRMALTITGRGVIEAQGDLMKEAYDLFSAGGELTGYLRYPFVDAMAMATDPGVNRQYAESFAKIETFAQMGALWVTNPALVERLAPRWARMFSQWEEARGGKNGSVEQSRATLRAVLQEAGTEDRVSGPVRAEGQREGSAGQDRRSLAVATAGPGVGTVRPAAGQRGGPSAVPTAEEAARAAGFLSHPTAKLPGDHEPTHFNYSVTLPLKDYRTISSPQDVLGTLSRQSELFEKEIQKQRRGTVSWDKTYKEAEGIYADLMGITGKTAASLLNRRPGTPAGAAELIARRDLAIKAADDVQQWAAKLRSKGALQTSKQEMAEFAAALERAGMIHSMFLGARAEAGRALNILRNTSRLSDQAGAIQDLLTHYRGGGSLFDIATQLGEINDVGSILRKAKAVSTPTIIDAVVELWKNLLLSGPVTHLANVAGNITYGTLRIPQALIAGLYGKMHVSDRDKVYIGESVAMAYGMVAGLGDSLRLAKDTFLHPETDEANKAEYHQPAFTGRTFHAKGLLGKSLDMVGEGVRIPYKVLGATDGFFRGMNASMSMHAAALRQALKEGGHYWDSGFQHRVAQLIAEARTAITTPDAKVSSEAFAIAEEAVNDGLKYTFNEKLGYLGNGLMKIRNHYPALNFIVPFLRTPMNIFRKSLESTPLAPLSKQWREEFAAGGHRRDTAMAQMTIGTSIGIWVTSMVMSGLITGGGEPEKEARQRRREAGILDYAIKIGDTWYEYRRLEPLGTVMGFSADLAEVWDYMNQEEREHASMMISMAFAQAVTSKTFWKGLSDVVNVIGDPERYGEGWGQSLAGTLVPSAISQYNDAFGDKLVRDRGVYGPELKGWDKTKEAFLNAVRARIPKTGATEEFNSEALPAKVDTWGEPVKKAERMFPYSPIRTSQTTTDPVRVEAYNLRIKGGVPSKEIMGVKLGPREYWEGFAAPAGRTAHELMTDFIMDPSWKDLPPFAKEQIFKEVIDEARNAARDMMIGNNPGIVDSVTNKLERDINAKPNQPRAR